MEHAIDARDGPGHGLRVGHVPFDELDPLAKALDVREESAAEVVEHSDLLAARDERLGDVRPDESRPAGD